MMNVKEAYDTVLSDILTNGSKLFAGKYDANNGDKHFMNGILTVMEYIAYKVDEETGSEFTEKFLQNMTNSEKNS